MSVYFDLATRFLMKQGSLRKVAAKAYDFMKRAIEAQWGGS